MKRKTDKPAKKSTAAPETCLILRTCAADMTSRGGFKWPESGPVNAPDWNPAHVCGGGLHGLLWGEGDAGCLNMSESAKWIVFRAAVSDIAHGSGALTDKCKARAGTVEYCGSREGATSYLYANGATGKAVVFGTATAGYGGTATAGTRGTATAGTRGTATAGTRGTATAGDYGTATAGTRGTATAGTRGVIAILRWNGKRYKLRIAQIKDEDGDGELEPNVKYRLNDAGDFVRADS